MTTERLPQQAPARNIPEASLDVIAERVENELARLREARPHLASRVDRAASVLVMQLSSSASTRPIRCRVRKGGRRVYLVSSLSSGGVIYEVSPVDWSCSCPDFHRSGPGCKHALGCWILATANTPLPSVRPAEIPCSDCGESFPRDRPIEVGEGVAEETLNPGDMVCRMCAPRHSLPAPQSSHETAQEADHDDADKEGEGCGSCHGAGWVYLAEDVVDPESGEVGRAHNPVRCRSCEGVERPYMTDEELAEWMSSARWIYAKSMPRHRHEYCLKREQAPELFERVVETIWATGYDRPYLRRVWRSLDVGRYYVWVAGAPPKPDDPAPVDTTVLINRALRVQERLGEGV